VAIELRYRELQHHEAELLRSIDRSEQIDEIYRSVDSTLILEAVEYTVPSWPSSELTEYVSRLHAVMISGGHAYGAWDDTEIVGIASLDASGVNGGNRTLKLDMLYVSSGYRGRGVGRKLTELAAAQACSLGATSLYISATPTRGTVEAYLRMGASVSASPDPELFEKEPEDIHLELRLGP